EIDRVLQVIHGRKNVALYLPESFEWMIMDADILKNNTVRSILSNPSEYVESKLYFSWERFFTAILIEQTKDTYLAYAKRKLNPAYLSGAIKESILRKMNIIDLNKKDE
ncbi:MAG: translation initiation factor 2, partial [Agathobacter rectalis]